MINLASKNYKYYTRSSLKEKPLELLKCFVLQLGGPNLTYSDSSSTLAA